MRKKVFEDRLVNNPVLVGMDVTCDLCGFDEDPTYIFEVKVCVDEDGCAGTRITRDVCQDCYDTKLARFFDPLFIELDAPNEDLNEENEDRWYG